MKNYFITLEGSEGVGKSTAMHAIEKYFSEKNKACVITREPGGTKIGEAIRHILLHATAETLLPETELLLLFAARAQHIAHVIKPALLSGKTVISDRFTDASFAYQGGGRQISEKNIQQLTDWISKDLQPDLTLLLDAPIDIGLSRLHQRGEKDRIENEKKEFFERVRAVYLARAKQYPKRFAVIDASQSISAVQSHIIQALDRFMVAT